MNYRAIIDKTGLTQDLSDDQVQILVDLATEEHYKAEDIIIPENSKTRDLYILSDGRISVVLNTPFENEQISVFESLQVGLVVGDISFVDGSPRSAAVVGKTATSFLRIPHDLLRERMAKDCNFGYLLMTNLAKILASRIRNTTLAFRNMSF
ncbi:cyclic nucleotide-binding domain-containing protein [bacterium]|nr:cyclic nucleotide-binding domain-containing protein [bacterium]